MDSFPWWKALRGVFGFYRDSGPARQLFIALFVSFAVVAGPGVALYESYYDAMDWLYALWHHTPKLRPFIPKVAVVDSLFVPGLTVNPLLLGERLVVAFGAALLTSKALSRLFDDRISALGVSNANAVTLAELKRAVAELTQQLSKESEECERYAGILRVFIGMSQFWEGLKDTSVNGQRYAAPIKEAVSESTRVRILSMAAYEYVGRGGSQSLLSEILLSSQGIELEVILLCPDAGKAALERRIEELRPRYPNYRVEHVGEEIAATEATLRRIAKSRNPGHAMAALWKTDVYPPFRLLLLDEVVFVSPYIDGIQGHESPVYRIEREHQPGFQRQSLYDCFERLYDQTKKSAKKIDLAS